MEAYNQGNASFAHCNSSIGGNDTIAHNEKMLNSINHPAFLSFNNGKNVSQGGN